jgi:hypothetical protein
MDASQIELLKMWAEVKAKIAPLAEQIKPLAIEELALRRQIIATIFANGKEGTNNLELSGDWLLKGVIKIDRKVDEAALPAVKIKMQEMNVNPDTLIEMKPQLVLKAYRELTEEQRNVFDQALDIKPAAPELSLVPPK